VSVRLLATFGRPADVDVFSIKNFNLFITNSFFSKRVDKNDADREIIFTDYQFFAKKVQYVLKSNNYHLEHFSHPFEYGYKDICHNWVIDRWDSDSLMDLYIEMGARYFMAMGVHHDNFDCWNSAYQPWNSVNVGPKVDIIGTWEKTARQHGLRFGIGFHNTPPRT
jgi:hypothetical protein